MKKITPLLLIALSACTTENITNKTEIYTYLNYAERIELTSAAQTRNIILSGITSSDWIIDPTDAGADWLTAQKLPDQTIAVTAALNDTGAERETFLTLQEGLVKNRVRVWQDCIRFITVDPAVELESSGQSRGVTVNTNLNDVLTAQIDSPRNSWLTFSLSGSTLTLGAPHFRSLEPRTATLNLTGFSSIGERITATLTVTQINDDSGDSLEGVDPVEDEDFWND